MYFDYDAAIFLKETPRNHELIERYKIDLRHWRPPPTDLLKLGVKNVTPYQYINRAEALFTLELYDQAEAEITEALRIIPHYSEAYKLLGKIYHHKKESAKAFENLRKAKLLVPGDVETRYYLGDCFYYLGDLVQAEKQCRIVLDKNAKNPKGLLLLFKIYAHRQEYQEAVDYLKEIKEFDKKYEYDTDWEEILKVAGELKDKNQSALAEQVTAFIERVKKDE